MCPITAGTHTDTSISAIPDFTGKVSCLIQWKTMAAELLMCIQTVMKLD